MVVNSPRKRIGPPPLAKAGVFTFQKVITFPPTPYSGRKRVEKRLRELRPLAAQYELGTAKYYIRGERDIDVEVLRNPLFTRPPDERFIHREVGHWLEDNRLTHLENKFFEMGVYTHADLVNLALDIRNHGNRQDFRIGSEESGTPWYHLRACVFAYARPTPKPET
ncbi:hypothetical protein BDZ89DRAFT_1128533 [Hymenopellis radicata]|nr:hypothetical protein BDZ89DRAFT_1142892 [Hymenopellis radicata]KAF9042629.1 hypothetical protein BDZ89DRAFT_1128533 [Hymenopellis radicata]